MDVDKCSAEMNLFAPVLVHFGKMLDNGARLEDHA